MKIIIIGSVIIMMLFNMGCKNEMLSYQEGDLKIEIITGENWLHEFEIFMGLKIKNPPQFAVWLEDENGNYLTTLYATYRVATGEWRANDGDMRLSALPYWNHKRGLDFEKAAKGNYEQLNEGITGATPKKNKEIMIDVMDYSYPIVVMLEVNQSTDFNEFYSKSAKLGDENYSGGEGGSGQPALIYKAILNSDDDRKALELIGHSSPDGSDGRLYTDLSKSSSAKSILDSAVVIIIN